jgi:RNA polymerase sigma-70 factor, ECF subfamily
MEVECPTSSAGPARAEALSGLIEGVAAGRSSAFKRLYSENYSTVVAVIQAILRDPWQSEEVAQEVFLEVWQKAALFDAGRGSAHGWISTVARRRAIDRVRAAQSARDRDVRSAQRETVATRDEVAEIVELRVEGVRIHEALQRLTPLQREALVTTYLDGQSVADAVTYLGASERALRTRMRDGLIELRRIIAPLGAAA